MHVGNEEVSYPATAWKSVVWGIRVSILNFALAAAIALWLPGHAAVRLIAAAAVIALAIVMFPSRHVGSALRVDADGIEYLMRDGRTERMSWDEITHYHASPLLLRVADFRQRPVFKGYAWPLLTSRGRAVVKALRAHAPRAVELSAAGWWKEVFRHARP